MATAPLVCCLLVLCARASSAPDDDLGNDGPADVTDELLMKQCQRQLPYWSTQNGSIRAYAFSNNGPADVTDELLMKQIVWKRCYRKITPSCLRLQLVRALEMMSSDIPLFPGISLSSNSSGPTPLPPALARSLSQEHGPLDDLVAFSLSKYLRALTLNINLIDFVSGGNRTYEDSVVDAFSGRGSKNGLGQYGPIAAMMGGMMASMMMAALAALAGKALMTSLLALMMAAFAALKGGGGGGESKTYEVISKPVVSHINTHSSEVQHDHGHYHRRRSLEGVDPAGDVAVEGHLIDLPGEERGGKAKTKGAKSFPGEARSGDSGVGDFSGEDRGGETPIQGVMENLSGDGRGIASSGEVIYSPREDRGVQTPRQDVEEVFPVGEQSESSFTGVVGEGRDEQTLKWERVESFPGGGRIEASSARKTHSSGGRGGETSRRDVVEVFPERGRSKDSPGLMAHEELEWSENPGTGSPESPRNIRKRSIGGFGDTYSAIMNDPPKAYQRHPRFRRNVGAAIDDIYDGMPVADEGADELKFDDGRFKRGVEEYRVIIDSGGSGGLPHPINNDDSIEDRLTLHVGKNNLRHFRSLDPKDGDPPKIPIPGSIGGKKKQSFLGSPRQNYRKFRQSA